MLRVWKLVRLLFIVVHHTARLTRLIRTVPLEEQDRFRAEQMESGCRRLCRVFGVHIHRVGDLPAHRVELAICNHFGVLDPLMLASQMPVTFAARNDLANWPLLGWVCREMGLIFVDRSRKTMTGDFVREVVRKRNSGVMPLVFPEGTTSGSGRILPFKTGAFATVEDDPSAAILPLVLKPIRIDGVQVTPESRTRVTWADNNETFLAHIWKLLGIRKLDIELRTGPLEFVQDRNRKELARILHAKLNALGND